MSRTKQSQAEPLSLRFPADNPEDRESQMVNLAVRLAERQLSEGTASSQVITHYLKLGSQREKLELEKLKKENELLRAKTEALQSQKRYEELVDGLMTAMKVYSGQAEEYVYE